MEFQYRAGDKRRSPSPSPPSPVPSPAPSAPKASADGHLPASGADADEVRRQREKVKIRERIMREETVDRFELELEVRLELVERFQQRSVVLNAGGTEQPVLLPLARVIAANSTSPVAPKVNSQVSAPAALLTKRKSPAIHDAASTASVETNNKKQNLGLTCTVCGMTATSEKAMKDHLNGKNHKKKQAAALAAQPIERPQLDLDPKEAEEEEAVFMASGDFNPTKFTMVTNAGQLNEVTQMDGYLLCEVCNVRTADHVTMMCHFEGIKHISKAQKMCKATGEPPAGDARPEKFVNEHAAPATTVASTDAGGDPDMLVLEVEGKPHTVRRQGGSLLCERCAVRAPSEKSMRLHLLGKKHKNKVDKSPLASANDANGKAQENEKDTLVVDETASHMEAPLAKPMQQNTSGLEDTMATSANKDVVTLESSEAPEKEAAKVNIGAPATVVNTVSESDLFMEADGVRHPLRRVEGILLCPWCDVKATSEVVMQSHLVGKKHRNKMTSKGATAEINAPKMAKSGGEADSDPPIMEDKNAAGAAADVVPMELDAPGEVETVITPNEPADHTTEPAGKPVTIYVDGKMFTLLRQENGRLSCEICGLRGCVKEAMVKHLYTRMHWEKASLAEKEQVTRAAAAAALVQDGNGGSPAGEGTAQTSGGLVGVEL